jgi:hypothetical protein
MKKVLGILGLLPVLALPVKAQTGPDATPEIVAFTFGNGTAKPGWIQISPTNGYSAASGYGFEPGADLAAANSWATTR